MNQGIQNIPLCVDLDGTLVRTDTLVESLLALLKGNPLYAFLLPLWLFKGKAYLKREVARRVTLDVTSLPYHQELLAYLSGEHRQGRHLVLVTASDVNIAKQVGSHLGIFSDVLGSDGKINLSGRNKSQALEERFGVKGFDYAGNGHIDLKVWPYASKAILVNPSERLLGKVEETTPVSHIFRDQKKRLNVLLKAIRIHQWTKNILLFVPLITAHRLTDPISLLYALLAFAAFSLCASGVYLLNDLLDLESDRRHVRKRNRPFAAGDLSPSSGILLIPLFLGGSFALSLTLSFHFSLVLALYLFLTTSYSFYFKRFVLVDVILLAGLYTIRIIAGAVAISVPASQWLLAFSMFIFLSLALAKRFSELHTLRRNREEFIRGRGYFVSDLEQLATFGISSGYIAVLVFALYIESKEVKMIYNNPQWLWLICPLLLYWISRIWLKTHRGQMHEDPIVFALEDKYSYLIGLLAAMIMLLSGASWGD